MMANRTGGRTADPGKKTDFSHTARYRIET